jgi:hypothetical protein
MSTSAIICAWAGGACLGIATVSILTPDCPAPAPAPVPAATSTLLVSQRVQTPLERCLARCTTGVCQRNCVFKHK